MQQRIRNRNRFHGGGNPNKNGDFRLEVPVVWHIGMPMNVG